MPTPKKRLVSKYAHFSGNKPHLEWLWYRRIPRGLVTIVTGMGGAGKSKAIASVLTNMLKQEEYPDGTMPGMEKSHILVLTTENDEYMIGEDFEAQGCSEEDDGPFIHVLSYVVEEGSETEYAFDLDLNYKELIQELDQWRPGVLVIDPLREFHSRKDNDSKQVRDLMMALDKLAKRYNMAILGVVHWNKDQKLSREARMAGSHQYRDAVRSVIVIEEDRKTKIRSFVQDKVSRASTPEELTFTIEAPNGMVAWTPVEGVVPATGVQECEQWLVTLLTSGPKPIKEIVEDCPHSERTLYKARKSLGGLIYKSTHFANMKYVETWELMGPENHWGGMSMDPPGMAKKP